jgi:hypothetical protein
VGARVGGMTYKREMTKLPLAGGKYFWWRKWEEIPSIITLSLGQQLSQIICFSSINRSIFQSALDKVLIQ